MDIEGAHVKSLLSRVAAVGVVAMALTLTLRAQAPASPPLPNFVASVKPADPNTFQIMVRNGPGRIDMVGVPLAILVRQAYQVQDSQVVGAPPWFGTDRFDIQVNIEGPAQQSPALTQAIMRAVLADRFGFKAHNESR